MKIYIYGLCLSGVMSSLNAQSQAAAELEKTTVHAEAGDALAGVQQAQNVLASVAGNTSLITPEHWTGRTVKPAEVFQFTPSVYAQSSGTANDTRLSIRGSGIQRKYGSRGLNLLLDGVPANSADGSFYTRVIEPLSIEYVEVFPGANGLQYGASQLGGAINIVQKTGVTAPKGLLQAEYGSFETVRGTAQYGTTEGAWDLFSSYSYGESDGYRDQQDWRSHHFTANAGYQWNEDALTRFYLLLNDSNAKLAGSLTPDEFAQNPRQSQPGRDPRTDRDLRTIRLAQRTAWSVAEAQYSAYAFYQNLHFDHLTGIGVGSYNNLIDYKTDEFGLGFQSENPWDLAGQKQVLRGTLSYDRGVNDVSGYSGFVPFPGVTSGSNKRDDQASNAKVYLSNEWLATAADSITVGAGWVQAYRQRSVAAENSNQENFDKSQGAALWRFGYLRSLDAKSQVFANISKSFEAAPFSEAANEVKPQSAVTYELGVRTQREWLTASLAAYLAQVKDEFVDVEVAPNRYAVTNEDTRHQGIEAFAGIDLTELFTLGGPARLYFDQSYQLNDFKFAGGVYDGNVMPGVSKHVYAGRLRVAPDSQKWSAALAVDWLPDGLIADNANTKKTAGYHLWKIHGEYQLREGLRLYGGIDNLFDRQFASTVTINPTSDSFINPGDGRAAYIGAKYLW